MATASLTANPTTVPFGGSSTITVSFQSAPADSYDVVLTHDGEERARGTVVFEAESVPVVSLGSTGQGWELRSTGGTLAALGGNQFRLSA